MVEVFEARYHIHLHLTSNTKSNERSESALGSQITLRAEIPVLWPGNSKRRCTEGNLLPTVQDYIFAIEKSEGYSGGKCLYQAFVEK